MKSNLIDALRRAQEEKSDTTLSDSGSFDTTQEEFAHPANQDLADAGFSDDAAELELMSTTRGQAVTDIPEVSGVAADTKIIGQTDEHVPAEFGETMASATVFLTGSDCVIPESGSLPSMPRLARHVPVLCMVLALVAGAGWQLFQRLDLRQDASALGAFGVPYQAGSGQQEIALADEPAVRFRYLSGPLTVSEDVAAR